MKKTKVKLLSITALRKEHKQLKEAMDAIRFLAFKHEIQYWLDATGTSEEKLHDILTLAREANWGVNGMNRTKKIKENHTYIKLYDYE